MGINGTMVFGSRKVWIACGDAPRYELWHGSDIQVDGKRFDETNQRKSFTDRAYYNKTYRQFQAGEGAEQIIFREGCYYA